MENNIQKRSMMLKASAILKYFLGSDDKIETLIMCKPDNVELSCLDQSLYEALGSLKDYDEFNFRKLVKFLENVDLISFKARINKPRPILTEERVEQLREEVLKGNQDEN